MPTQPTHDLVTVGLTTLDVTVRAVDVWPAGGEGALVEKIALSPAGTAGGTAHIAARLGLSTCLISAIGDDPQGALVREALARGGVDTHGLVCAPDHPTSTTVLPIRSDGERPTLHMPGASSFMTIDEDAQRTLALAKAIHWGCVGFPGITPEAIAALARAHANGAFVTCDLIGVTPETRAHLAPLLPHVDLFMPSLAEVEVLAGTRDLQAAAHVFLRQGAAACLFKLGARGALYISATRHIEVPAFAITPRDTTSCGDAFCAGFHAARTRGLELEEILRFASATSALVAQDVSTIGRLESFEETLAYAHSAPLRERSPA